MEARRDLTNHARSLALGTVDSAAPIPVATDAFSDDALNRSSSGPTPLAHATRRPRRRRARRGRHHHRRRRHRRRRREHRRRGDASRSPRESPRDRPIADRVRHRASGPGGSRRVVGGGGGRGSRFERNSSCARNGWWTFPRTSPRRGASCPARRGTARSSSRRGVRRRAEDEAACCIDSNPRFPVDRPRRDMGTPSASSTACFIAETRRTTRWIAWRGTGCRCTTARRRCG